MVQFQHSGHKIKPNHSNALPRYILAIDTEYTADNVLPSVDSIAHKFKCVSVASGRFVRNSLVGVTCHEFSTAGDFWRHVFSFTRHNYTTWLVGDNILPQLIVCGLPRRFATGEISIDRPRNKRTKGDNNGSNQETTGLAVLESPPTIIGCRVASTQGRIVAVDTRNWFQTELPTGTAAARQATTGKDAVRCWDNSQRPSDTSKAIQCLTVFENLIHWVKDNRMGLFRYTAGSQAMSAYRHRFMRHRIYVHDNRAIQKLERRCYYGGRSEVYRMGAAETVVSQLDVSALFPSVMEYGYYPCRLSRFECREELIGLLPAIDWSAACADVEIETRQPLYPLRTDSVVIYPTGVFKTSLCGADLYRAWRSGCIRRVGSWAEYKLERLFTEWVTELWAMRQSYRQSGNAVYEQFTKLIMNSLYGKFAQLTPAWVNVAGDHSMLPWTTEHRRDSLTAEWTKYRSIGWQVQRQQDRIERPASFYAISAFVTAAARARMDTLRNIAGKSSVYYQGVDSVIVDTLGRDRLAAAGEIMDNTIGKLRLQYESDYCVIRGVSDYEIGDRVVLSSRAERAELNDSGTWINHRYYVMNNLFSNGPINSVEERLQPWVRTGRYKKGVVQADGVVEPFELGAIPTSANTGVGSADAAADAISASSGP